MLLCLNRPISMYYNSTLRNRPQHKALWNTCKSHKLCSYSPETHTEVYCLRLNFNIYRNWSITYNFVLLLLWVHLKWWHFALVAYGVLSVVDISIPYLNLVTNEHIQIMISLRPYNHTYLDNELYGSTALRPWG